MAHPSFVHFAVRQITLPGTVHCGICVILQLLRRFSHLFVVLGSRYADRGILDVVFSLGAAIIATFAVSVRAGTGQQSALSVLTETDQFVLLADSLLFNIIIV